MKKDLYCRDCEHYEACRIEFCVGEYTIEQSVIGCMVGDGYKNIPDVNEDGVEMEVK